MNEIKNYLSSLLQTLEEGSDVMSVTIIESLGSAPRGAGARMLVGKSGRICGTVGGGSIEYEAQKEAARLLQKRISAYRQYDLSEHSSKIGMVCGGSIKAAFHYLSAERSDIKSLCRTALNLLKSPKVLWLVLELPPLSGTQKSNGGEFMGIYSRDIPLPSGLPAILTESCQQKQSGIIASGERKFYLEPIASDSLVHIFGGGHVARELVPLLARTGFFCAVYDNREEFLKKEDFPGVSYTAVVSFDKLEGSLYPAAENYFIIMTRGHLFDLQVQAFAMRTPSVYIGVMGSRKKTALLTEKLLELGFRHEELERIHAPIGLAIGADSPSEIAVSIAAELIQVRSWRNNKGFTQQLKESQEE